MPTATRNDFPGYVGLTQGALLSRLSISWLRILADSGRIRSLRDPQGRRLLLREDVERLGRESNGAPRE